MSTRKADISSMSLHEQVSLLKNKLVAVLELTYK